jgi:tetratricopeptide (TPR) repeat protein
LIGQLESFRDVRLGGAPIARYRMPFEPVFDIPTVSATYNLLRAAAIEPDFSTSMSLAMLFDQRSMHEQSVPWFERLSAIEPINPQQSRSRKGAMEALSARLQVLGARPELEFANSDELDHLVKALLDRGRVASAADLLERAYPNPAGRTWPMTDQMATLRLHLGQPDRARALWASAVNPPRPAVRDARIAVALLIEGSTDAARASYLRALDAEPTLFEALYGLALLESDAGRASEAFSAADRAFKAAPGEAGRNAAGAIEEAAGKFAKRNPSADDADEHR